MRFPGPELLYVSRCRLLGAAAAADPSKRRLPARKPHATERRQRLLLLLCPQRHGPGVSRGRNVPSEISYKKLAVRFEAGCWLAASCCTAAVALTAASACVCCCLLMPAAACCCLLLPAAACCLLLPAAPCCCARKDTALPDGETPWP